MKFPDAVLGCRPQTWTTTVLADRGRPELAGRVEDWGWLLHGIEWTSPGGALTLFNALDENGIAGRLQQFPVSRNSALIEVARGV